MYEKQFNKQLLKAKRDAEDFENSIKYWICDNAYVDSDIKVRYHFHWKIYKDQRKIFLFYFTT